jgi:hypothetical protein
MQYKYSQYKKDPSKIKRDLKDLSLKREKRKIENKLTIYLDSTELAKLYFCGVFLLCVLFLQHRQPDNQSCRCFNSLPMGFVEPLV